MRRVFIVLLILVHFHGTGQEPDPFIQTVTGQISKDTIVKYLEEFEALGIKEINTPELVNTGEWIIDKYNQYGYQDIWTDYFDFGGGNPFNVVVTKLGYLYPDRYYILGAHYDTRNGPGVDDNGTGTALLLETARLLKDIECAFSIRFIHFSAEEEGLVGSYHYVQEVVEPQNMDILLMFNIDMVGGVNGMVNNIVKCERDESAPVGNNQQSADFTDTVAGLMEIYSGLETQISNAFASDYMPFQQYGHIITGLFEYNFSQVYHSIYDSLSRLDTDYVYEVAKGCVAAAMYFSKATDSISAVPDEKAGPAIRVGPNPFDRELVVDCPASEHRIRFELFDFQGTGVYESLLSPGTKTVIPLPPLVRGLYSFRVAGGDGNISASGLLLKK